MVLLLCGDAVLVGFFPAGIRCQGIEYELPWELYIVTSV